MIESEFIVKYDKVEPNGVHTYTQVFHSRKTYSEFMMAIFKNPNVLRISAHSDTGVHFPYLARF